MYAHGGPRIPQPPHSAGLKNPGLRTRIDPSQVPSVVELQELDRDEWELSSKAWTSQPDTRVPLSTTDYSALDQGNSTPRFIRVSTWALPHSSKLASACRLPLAAIIQPFAEPEPYYNQEGVNENLVPVIDTGESGPMRCSHCRAYVNPSGVWISGGNKWKCNLCKGETEVPTDYFCNLDQNGLRLDQFQRPELYRGTVDFIVPNEYWANNPPPKITMPYHSPVAQPTGPRAPQPLNYVFAIDVSHESVASGMLFASCEALRASLFGRDEKPPSIPPSSEIGIITFDRSLHFYDLSCDPIPMMVMSDLDEVFLPLRNGFFVNPDEKRESLDSFLTKLPERFSNNLSVEASLGSVIRSCLAALSGRGGQAVIFQSTMPTSGSGALSSVPKEADLRETDKEKALYLPRNEVWPTIADEATSEGVGVTFFLCPSKFIDIGSIGIVATRTGGDIFFHPRFEPERDGPLLESELRRSLSRLSGYNCTMRVRASTGIRIKSLSGSFTLLTPEEMGFGTMDADKAISVLMERSSTGSTRDFAHIQCALLYTSISGQRRVRVCNLSLPVVELAGNVFQYGDMDALVACMAKDAAQRISSEKMSFVREDLTDICAATLLGYRELCSAAAAPTQLILPEAFRALPVYTLGILKSKVLKGTPVNPDVRNYMAHRFLCMGVRSLNRHFYPRFLALHDLEDSACFPDPATGKLSIPSPSRCSHHFMRADGIYLIDNEESQILWVGASCSPKLLQDLFGVDDILSINSRMHTLPVLDSLLSAQVRNILTHRDSERGGRQLRLMVVRQNMDGLEIDFSDMLVEDQNNYNSSYPDFLTLLHKQIAYVLNGGSSFHDEASMRSPW